MPDRAKNKIWRGLVDYANALNLETDADVLTSFAATLFDCMPWMARTAFGLNDVPEMIAQQIKPDTLLNLINGKERAAWLYFKSEQQLEDQFRRQAVAYQPQVRQLLTWLSDRKRNDQDRADAFAFLREHMKHIEFQRGDLAFAPQEEESRYFTMGGDLKDDFPYRTYVYKDVADVICDFIQKEHELARDVPIRICKRPGCGKLVTQFKKREYCRTASCDRERQKRDDDLKRKKNSDNVFLCRLRKMPLAMRRKKARESIDRLREIESSWQDKNQSLTKHALELLDEG
jgi:hypothetical protein